MKNSTRVYCTEKNKFPQQAHYVILEFNSYSSRGYDRGDPDYTSNKADYIAYLDKQEWLDEIKRRVSDKGYTSNDFVAFIAGKPVTYRTEVIVEENESI